MGDKGNVRLDEVLKQLEADGESVEEFDHDDPRLEGAEPEGDMSAGEEGELP